MFIVMKEHVIHCNSVAHLYVFYRYRQCVGNLYETGLLFLAICT